MFLVNNYTLELSNRACTAAHDHIYIETYPGTGDDIPLFISVI